MDSERLLERFNILCLYCNGRFDSERGLAIHFGKTHAKVLALLPKRCELCRSTEKLVDEGDGTYTCKVCVERIALEHYID